MTNLFFSETVFEILMEAINYFEHVISALET
jgi:hypothetical protein